MPLLEALLLRSQWRDNPSWGTSIYRVFRMLDHGKCLHIVSYVAMRQVTWGISIYRVFRMLARGKCLP